MLAGVAGDEFSAFYLREMPRLVWFVKTVSASLDWHAAADVAQTAFERALPRWAGLSHPKGWLYRVARNEARARCEAMQRELPADVLPDRPDELSAELAVQLLAEEREVQAYLQALPPRQREVMTWMVAGFADAEICEATGLSADAVRQNRRLARRNLRKRLGDEGEGVR
jgi:RNA polymerase sigma-70 factor (ECF subfamily)